MQTKWLQLHAFFGESLVDQSIFGTIKCALSAWNQCARYLVDIVCVQDIEELGELTTTTYGQLIQGILNT